MNGVDVAGVEISTAQWQQFRADLGIEFAIVRCFRNAHGGVLDTSCLPTVLNAIAAGIPSIDVYHFPVINARTPEDQANMTMDFITGHDLDLGVIWLDVEQSGSSWHADSAANVEFITRWCSAVSVRGGSPGIYAGTDGWNQITGHSHALADNPIWWSSHGKQYSPFGGWPHPHTIQSRYDQVFHGIGYDADLRT